MLPALMEELPASTSTACNEPGFEVFYPVPDECEDLPGGLEESCYLNLYDVVAVSLLSLSITESLFPAMCDVIRMVSECTFLNALEKLQPLQDARLVT